MKYYLYHHPEDETLFGHFSVGFEEPETHEFIRHNPCGPSFISPSRNICKWCLYNKQYTSTTEYCHTANMSKEDALLFTIIYGDKLPTRLEDLHPDHDPLSTMEVKQVL